MKIIAGATYSLEVLELKSSRRGWTLHYHGEAPIGQHALHISDDQSTNMWFIYHAYKHGQRYYKCVYVQ